VLLALAFTVRWLPGKFNIGGEGQMIVAPIGAAAAASSGDLPIFLLLPLVILAGCSLAHSGARSRPGCSIIWN